MENSENLNSQKQAELDAVIEELKVLLREYKGMGGNIYRCRTNESFYDGEIFLSYVSNSFSNVSLKYLRVLEEGRDYLNNMILMKKLHEVNNLLEEVIDRDDNVKDNLDKYTEIVINNLCKINSTKVANKFFNRHESVYLIFFELVYKIIKLNIKYGAIGNLGNIYSEVNKNSDVVKILNELVKSDFEVIKKSSIVGKDRFINLGF